jgi:RimJ/RimL family protein N-acetyltransferase
MAEGVPAEVTVRDVIDADVEVFFEYQLDPEAARIASVATRDREAFFAYWARMRADKSVITATVITDGRVAGHVVSGMAMGRRWVAYWIGRRYWGLGVATRAVGLVLHQVRQRPLYAYVAAHNQGSRRVLEKCGFRLFGPGEVGAGGVEELTYVLDLGDPAQVGQ